MMKLFYVLFLALLPTVATANDWRLSLDVDQSAQSSAKFSVSSPQIDALVGGRIGLFVGQMQYPQAKGTEKEFVRTKEGGLSLGFAAPLTPSFHYMSTLKVGYVQAPAVQTLSEEHKYAFTAIDTGFALVSPTKEDSSWLSGLLLETGIGWQSNWIDQTEVMMIGNTMVEDDFFYPYLRLHLDL